MCLATQLCPTLCDLMDCNPPGSSVHGDSLGKNTGGGSLSLLQGIFLTQELNPRLLLYRQILYHLSHQVSPMERTDQISCSVVSDSLRPHGLQPARLLCPWGFSRQEYRSGLPCPLSGDLPNPGIEPRSSALQADSSPSEPPGKSQNTGVDRYPFSRGSS